MVETVQVLQRPRLPAALVLAAAAGAMVALTCLRPIAMRDQAHASDDAEAVQQRIAAGKADAATWLSFARRLEVQGNFRHAAAAYQQVLAAEPYHRDARIGCACALARAGDAEGLYRFLHGLAIIDPLLALDLFNRAEVKPFLSQARFQALVLEARTQAID